MGMIRTVSDLIDGFGGATEFSRAIGAKPSTASEMKRRGSIPVTWWPLIVDEAARRGIGGVTFESLTYMHAPRAGVGADSGPDSTSSTQLTEQEQTT